MSDHEKVLGEALLNAVNWWATVAALVDASGNRGVAFKTGYEPHWLPKAVDALNKLYIEGKK